MLLFHSPIHRIISKGFFSMLHATNRRCNSPRNNNNNKGYNRSKFYMTPTYKHPIDIGWNNRYWNFQLIDFGKYFILPF